MKIAVVSTVEYDRNGISDVINRLYANREFAQESILFTFPEIERPDLCRTLTRWNHEVLTIPQRLRKPLLYMRRLMHWLKERKVDLVHIQGNGSTCILEVLAAKAAGVPAVVVHAHSVCCKYPMLHKVLKPFLNRLVTDRFACSAEAGAFLFGKKDCTVIANAFEVEKYRADLRVREKLRREYELDGKVVLGHVGIFSPVKNQTFLLDVLQHYCAVEPNAVLVLVGSGEQQESVRRRAQEMRLADRVIFTGSRDDVNELLNMFDYFLFPSIAEGLGIAPIEAQANGLPVLASLNRVPACVCINDNFRFIPLENGAERWSQALLELSSARCTQGVENVRKAGYDLENEVIRFKKLLLRICEERKSQCS